MAKHGKNTIIHPLKRQRIAVHYAIVTRISKHFQRRCGWRYAGGQAGGIHTLYHTFEEAEKQLQWMIDQGMVDGVYSIIKETSQILAYAELRGRDVD